MGVSIVLVCFEDGVTGKTRHFRHNNGRRAVAGKCGIWDPWCWSSFDKKMKLLYFQPASKYLSSLPHFSLIQRCTDFDAIL